MLRSAEKRSTASVLRAEQRGGKDDILAPPGGRRADGEAAAVTSGLTAAPTKSFLSNKTFVDMRLAPPVVAALKSVGISRVSAIQELALPTILSGRTALVGAETGSGKTLLYTLPIAQLAFRISNAAAKAAVNPTPAEAVGGDAASQPGAVALMLLPNQELVLQSAAVLRMITQGLPCRIIPLSSGIPAELPPAAGPAPGWLTVYAATPAAFVNFADKARRAAAAPAAPAVGAPQAAAFVESTAAPLDGSAAASGSEPAPALPTSKAAARRARSAAAAAAAAVAHDVVPGLSPAVIVALDEADLLASPTHRSSVERALIAVGAARLLDDSDAPAKAAGSSTAATASTASTSKAKASSTSRPGAGSASADESLERAAGAGAASASGPGGRRLVLLPTTQVIATAATLLEPLRTSGASLQDGFGAWLHRHMRDAAIIRSPGLHRPTSLVRVRHVFVRDADIVEGLQLHDRDVDADERKLGPGQRAGASADASDSSTAAAAGGAEGVTSGSGSAETDWEEVLAARRASALLRAVRLTVPERLAATADSKTAAFPPASDATLADGSAAEPLLEEADAAMNATAPTAANNVKPQQRGKPQAAAETDGGAAERDSDRGQVLVFVNDALTADEVAGALQALGAYRLPRAALSFCIALLRSYALVRLRCFLGSYGIASADLYPSDSCSHPRSSAHCTRLQHLT